MIRRTPTIRRGLILAAAWSALAPPGRAAGGEPSPLVLELPETAVVGEGQPAVVEARLRNAGDEPIDVGRPDRWINLDIRFDETPAHAWAEMRWTTHASLRHDRGRHMLRPGEAMTFPVWLDAHYPCGLQPGRWRATAVYQPDPLAAEPGPRVESNPIDIMVGPASAEAVQAFRLAARRYWGVVAPSSNVDVGAAPADQIVFTPSRLGDVLDLDNGPTTAEWLAASELTMAAAIRGELPAETLKQLVRYGRDPRGLWNESQTAELLLCVNRALRRIELPPPADDDPLVSAATRRLAADGDFGDGLMLRRLQLEDAAGPLMPPSLMRVYYGDPPSPYRSTTAMLIARALYWQKEYDRALGWLDRLARDDPALALASQARELRFRCLLRSGRVDEARRVAETLHDGWYGAQMALEALERRP